MREVPKLDPGLAPEAATFCACLATVLELPLEQLPRPAAGEDPAATWALTRWLGGRGLGLVPISEPASFSWAGPWIARVVPATGGPPLSVVMYGVPSGVVWDPAGATEGGEREIASGFVVAPLDVALTPPAPMPAPPGAGRVEAIYVAAGAGAAPQRPDRVEALAGRGLEGDRHVTGDGTFPSGPPGSALTLIEAEVCESFEPRLRAEEHRRNLLTRGIDLNALVGHGFAIGTVRCRGARLCEPCRVVDGYASRPVLRALVHRGGLRADILSDGEIEVGDEIRADPGS